MEGEEVRGTCREADEQAAPSPHGEQRQFLFCLRASAAQRPAPCAPEPCPPLAPPPLPTPLCEAAAAKTVAVAAAVAGAGLEERNQDKVAPGGSAEVGGRV